MKRLLFFSVIASKSLKCSLLDIFRTDLNLKSGLYISHKNRKHMFANKFFKLSTYALVFT